MPKKHGRGSTDEMLHRVLEKLDEILRVLSLQVGADKGITERARLLKLAGMDNITIAEVLNTTPASVSVLTTGLRMKKGRRKRRRKR